MDHPPPQNKLVLDAMDAEAEEKEPCAVCLGNYNKNTRKPIQCLYCNATICRSCVQTYLLADGSTEANCPGCRAAWGQEFLIENLTAAFRSRDFKQHRERVLLDRERVRLPETQQYAEQYKYANEAIIPILENIKKMETDLFESSSYKKFKATQKQFDENERALHRHYSDWYRNPEVRSATAVRDKIILQNAEIDRLKRNNPENKPIPELKPVPPLPEYPNELKQCHELRKILSEEIRNIRKELMLLETIEKNKKLVSPYKYTIRNYGLVRGVGAGGGAAAKRTERQFICKCPAPDCAGFLNQSSWECGLCHTKACKHCRESVVDAETHVCNPDTVETVKAISKEARPCPKCGTLISKISGCDQMWCTQCKTAFSWNTGCIETSVIHNPHYFQWMRESGKEIPRRDVPGDACNYEYRLDTLFRTHKMTRNSVLYKISQIEMHRRHIAFTIQNLRTRQREYEQEEWRRVLRVQRMVNEISEEEWKIKLQRKEKAYYKERAQLQLYDMYINVCRDIFSHLLDTAASEDTFKRVYDQWKELYYFVEQERLKINKAYNCSSLNIFTSRLLQNLNLEK